MYLAVVSYDGNRVLYRRASSPDYWVLDRVKEKSKVVEGRARCLAPRWSMDSTKLLWHCLSPQGTESLLLTDYGGGDEQLIQLEAEIRRQGIVVYKAVEWSASGDSVYCLWLREVNEIQQRSISGEVIKVWPLSINSDRLMAHGVDALAASPDGSKLLIATGLASRKKVSQGTGTILMLDLKSGKPEVMLTPELEAYTPVWSPDSASFFFSGRPHLDDEGNRYRLNEEGVSTGPFNIYRRHLDHGPSEILIRDAEVLDYR